MRSEDVQIIISVCVHRSARCCSWGFSWSRVQGIWTTKHVSILKYTCSRLVLTRKCIIVTKNIYGRHPIQNSRHTRCFLRISSFVCAQYSAVFYSPLYVRAYNFKKDVCSVFGYYGRLNCSLQNRRFWWVTDEFIRSGLSRHFGSCELR